MNTKNLKHDQSTDTLLRMRLFLLFMKNETHVHKVRQHQNIDVLRLLLCISCTIKKTYVVKPKAKTKLKLMKRCVFRIRGEVRTQYMKDLISIY